jgi:RNA polymerase sigma factor (TIGR02999 family)
MFAVASGRPVGPSETDAAVDASLRSPPPPASAGDPTAAALFATLYRELHAVAERELRRRGGELTLGTTTLLHEAYLNLEGRAGARFADRGHFLAYASRAMRGLVIDYARRQRAQKRGGEYHLVALDEASAPPAVDGGAATADGAAVERLGEALEALGRTDARLAELVDLHFFCGIPLVEIAVLRGVSDRTVQRDWRRARLLLHRALAEASHDAG